MSCGIDDLAQHLLYPERAQRGRVVQVRVAEVGEPAGVRIEERRPRLPRRQPPALPGRAGCTCGRRSWRAPATETMPATSSAAGIGSIRSRAGSTGLPSKSVTTKRPPLRSTWPTCRSPCPSMIGRPRQRAEAAEDGLDLAPARACTRDARRNRGRAQTVSSVSNAASRHRAASWPGATVAVPDSAACNSATSAADVCRRHGERIRDGGRVRRR